jgi:hypothetical protein
VDISDGKGKTKKNILKRNLRNFINFFPKREAVLLAYFLDSCLRGKMNGKTDY